MITVTRLNNQAVAINPDHIRRVEAAPDTTVFLIGGSTLLIRESIAELVEHIVRYRKLLGQGIPEISTIASAEENAHRDDIAHREVST